MAAGCRCVAAPTGHGCAAATTKIMGTEWAREVQQTSRASSTVHQAT